MAILPIVLYPDPVLLRPTEPVERVDDEIRELVRNMAETMHQAPGIGLAANQVGVPKRIFLADLSAGEDPEALENALQELSRLSYGLTEKLYSALGGEVDDVDESDEADAAPASETDSGDSSED